MIKHLLRKQITAAVVALCATAIGASGKTITVANTNDSGPGSLRNALTEANGNTEADTINFDPGLFSTPRTITLTSGELVITRDDTVFNGDPGRLVTINGPGADRLTISGNNTSRVFFLSSHANVAMSGMTVRDGNGVGTVLNNEGQSGGAMLAHLAYISLSGMTFRNNTVTNSGGAIYLSAANTFSVSGSLLTENSAANGGAIFDFQSTTKSLTDTTISSNSARTSSGGAAFSSFALTIANCRIIGNRCGLAGAAGGGGTGGGLTMFQTTATVADTVISNNSAGDPAAGTIGDSGGVEADGAEMTFRRVTVTGNKVNDTSGGSGQAGGMALRAAGKPITVIDSLVSGNSGGEQGGGIYTSGSAPLYIINTTIANNTTSGPQQGFGGGIANFSSNLFVTNCTIVNNASTGGTNGTTVDGGGGIHNAPDFGGVLRIQNSIVAKNNDPRAPDVAGPFISNGYNLIGAINDEATGFGATGDQLGVDPLLSADGLQNNGGATLTIALQPNSPAIDKGKTGADVTTDQRGVNRPTDNPSIVNAAGGDGSDIGAYEVGAGNGVAEKTLGNIATRLPVQTGENVLIGGIIVVGDAPKRLLIRALGPSLAASGVAGTLQDPILEIYQGENLQASNDNWKTTQEEEIRNTGVAPTDDREAAIAAIVQPGSYTAVLRGAGDTTGVGLIEVYDLEQRADSKLGNISTRGFVSTGENVLIGGFIVGPTTKVVVRAIGPSLTNGGVAGALQDPTLDLVNANGEVLRTNDNWKGTQRAELEAIGIQPSDDRESALVATLTAGNYTAVVRGVGSNTGVGLVEVYNIQ